jgi:hypothetical protein
MSIKIMFLFTFMSNSLKMRFAWQTLKWLRGHPCDQVDRRYLMPRLARAAIDPWFSRRSSFYLTNLPIYRTCLEEIRKGNLETLMYREW